MSAAVRIAHRCGSGRPTGRTAGSRTDPPRGPVRSTSRRLEPGAAEQAPGDVAAQGASRGSSGSRSATVTSAVMPVAARSPVATWAARRSRAIPRRRQAGATPSGEDLARGPIRRDGARAPRRPRSCRRPRSSRGAPRRRPAATSRCASDASAGAMTPGARRQAGPCRRVDRRDDRRSRRRCRGAVGPRGPTARARPRQADPTSRGPARRGAAAGTTRRRTRAAVSRRMRLGGRLRRVEQHPGVGRVDEPLGERRLPVPGRLRRPSIAPRGRRGVRDLAMRPRQPDQRPRPWHDAIRVVPAATGRQPPAAGGPVRHRVDEPGRLAHRGRRHPQVRERIPGVGIGAVLGDDQVGPERGRQLGEQRPDGRQPCALTGPRLERHVDRGPRGVPLAQLPDVAGPREEVPAGLVERQGQDAGVLPVDRLDAVTVVDVQVDIQDAKAVAACACDGQGGIVVDAEPGCAVGHRVMEPAARVEGMLDVAAEDRLDRPERSAGDHRPGLVHPGEGRIVAALADARLEPAVRLGREPLDDLDVAPGVAPAQLLVRRGLRGEARLGPDRAQEIDPGAEPPGRQGVRRAEVVGG